MKQKLIFLMLAAMLVVVGCSKRSNPMDPIVDPQEVVNFYAELETEPAGAVFVHANGSIVTPDSVELVKASEKINGTLSKDGYQDMNVTLTVGYNHFKMQIVKKDTVPPVDSTGTLTIAINRPESSLVKVTFVAKDSVVWQGEVTRTAPVVVRDLKVGAYHIYASPEGHNVFSENRTFGSGNWDQDVRIELDAVGGDNPTERYTLTVNSGYGDGNYPAGEQVQIFADAPVAGQHFVGWVGDISFVTDPSNEKTTVTMPSQNITVTATYTDNPVERYTLTVNSGYGDGNYPAGEQVQIFADAPVAGQHFVGWVGDISFVTDPSNEKTTVTMPSQNITVTATYEDDEININPLRVEMHGNSVRLYGDGHENWLGLECYDPDQNQDTGWLNNLWVEGVDKGEYVEWTIADVRFSHCVIWKSAVAGYENAGGAGVAPRFAEWSSLEKGSGISEINLSPGYFVIAGR
jgi:uncharacterized repeat protein (TIGR02543 family)